MATERRVEPRFSIQQMVELSYGHESFVHASGINISKSGLSCATDSFVEPYTEVSMVMNVPSGADGKRIECDGIVVRCEKKRGQYVTGISFTSLAGPDIATLEAFLKTQDDPEEE